MPLFGIPSVANTIKKSWLHRRLGKAEMLASRWRGEIRQNQRYGLMEEHVKRKIPTECVSWRWHGNLGDDMIFAAQEAMFEIFALGQYVSAPEALLIGGGTFVPKKPEHPDLIELSQQLPTAFFGTGIGDPALYFAGRNSNPHRFDGRIAVNLGITYGQLNGFDEQKVEKTIIRVLRQLSRNDWTITLVCAWEPDDVVIERIRDEVPVSAVEHWHDDYARALESVEKFDMVLCEKLHVGVVAACKGIPFVVLNYRSKVMDFCRSINWEKFCVNTENLESGHILELIATLARVPDEYSKRLQQNVNRVKKRLLGAVPRIISALVVR